MPFRRNLNPIRTEKVEVQWTNLAANFGAANVNIPIAVQGSDNLDTGDHVNWIFFEINIAAQTTTNPKTMHWVVIKTRTGQAIPNSSTVNQAIKAQILKRGMEMLPSDVATVYKRVFVVRLPRSIRRFREGDAINISFRSSSTETANVCGIAIFRIIK